MRDNLNAELHHAAKRAQLTDEAVSRLELLAVLLGLLCIVGLMLGAAVWIGSL